MDFNVPRKREHVKNKLLHFDAVGCAGFDVVTIGVHKGNLLYSNMLLQLVLVLPVAGKQQNPDKSHQHYTDFLLIVATDNAIPH